MNARGAFGHDREPELRRPLAPAGHPESRELRLAVPHRVCVLRLLDGSGDFFEVDVPHDDPVAIESSSSNAEGRQCFPETPNR